MAPISVYYVQWPRTPPMTIKIFESYVYDDDELCILAYPKIKNKNTRLEYVEEIN